MNYYQANQRRSDSRWDYTRNQYPTGYCCEYREINPKVIPISEAEQKRYHDTAHKHHTDGHATEEEACECYRGYLLDHRLSLGRTQSSQDKCKICSEWTQNFAEVGNRLFVLCSEHNNRESVEALLGTVGWSCSSW